MKSLTDRERFLRVAKGQETDFVPIFGFPGSPGMSAGCMEITRANLVEQGMPSWVGEQNSNPAEYLPGWWGERNHRVRSWFRYWGTTGPIGLDFSMARPSPGIREECRVEGDFEIIEYETGALTRQVINNDETYSMPHFASNHVRDRASWRFYLDRTATPGPKPADEIERLCRTFDGRELPLVVPIPGTYGWLRSIWGEEHVCTIPYDDPMLVHEQVEHVKQSFLTYTVPLIERLKPEIGGMAEDICYNHGMLISPAQFEEFFGDYYRLVGSVLADCNVPVFSMDTDGNCMEFAGIAVENGINCLHPMEVKAGNDAFELRKKYPELVMVGWLEKESVNKGNEGMIRSEIMSKVPLLLESKRYFPNGDHGIQPLVTFDNLCAFMTLLHEVCNNPLGEFPRRQPQ
jgi:hypothetical protein